MRVFLFRHGEAQPLELGQSDAERRLTSTGVVRSQNAGRALKRLNVRPARLFCSPLARARQTAEMLDEALAVGVTVRDELGYNFNADALAGLVADLPPEADVICVGHEPTFSMTVRQLTSANAAVKRGGLARIDIADGLPLRGELVWLITPRLFDAMV